MNRLNALSLGEGLIRDAYEAGIKDPELAKEFSDACAVLSDMQIQILKQSAKQKQRRAKSKNIKQGN